VADSSALWRGLRLGDPASRRSSSVVGREQSSETMHENKVCIFSSSVIPSKTAAANFYRVRLQQLTTRPHVHIRVPATHSWPHFEWNGDFHQLILHNEAAASIRRMASATSTRQRRYVAVASEEPEHDARKASVTRNEALEELAVEYFRYAVRLRRADSARLVTIFVHVLLSHRFRPRYQVWKVCVALLIAAVITAVYTRYKYSPHDSAMQLLDNFGASILQVTTACHRS